MNKKHLLLIFLCILLLISYTKVFAADNNEKIIIKIWDFPRWLEDDKSLDRFSWITRKINEFEQLHPEAKVPSLVVHTIKILL